MTTATVRAAATPSRTTEVAGVLAVFAGLPVAVVTLRWWRWPAVAVLVLAAQHAGRPGVIAAVVAPLVVAVVLRVCWRAGWVWVSGRVMGAVHYQARYRWRWVTITSRCGLTVRNEDGALIVPRIRCVVATPAGDVLHVRLVTGQTPDDYATAADSLAHAFRALAVKVETTGPGRVLVHVQRRDTLTVPVPALPIPDQVDPHALVLGVTEHGTPWRLRLLGTHLLVVGATGSGKGSVLWSTVRALAPWLRAGRAVLWVADPKGGMELAPGQPLFAKFAHDADSIVELVEDAARLVQDRAARLRGVTRAHTPTTAEPWVVLVVDELAFLTAYAPSELRKRGTAALNVVLSQGRAVAVTVVGALQDPRKEALSMRDLFPTRIGLRLVDADQVALALGKGARDRGAYCDHIPVSTPGVGYVHLDGHPEPLRVRAAHVTDDDITAMTLTHAAPPRLRAVEATTEGEAA